MENHIPSNETGRRPRQQFTSQQINEYLQTQARSGLTIAAFCQQHGLHPSSFYGWKRRQQSPATVSPTFHEVTLPALPSSAWVAEIALPTGIVLRWTAQADLARLASWLSPLRNSEPIDSGNPGSPLGSGRRNGFRRPVEGSESAPS